MSTHELHDTKADYEHDLEAHDEWFRHGSSEPHHQEMHGATNPYAIMTFLLVVTLSVAVTVLVVFQYFLATVRDVSIAQKEEPTNVLAGPFQERKNAWQNELTSPGWIDAQAGVVRLPIDIAAEKVLADYAARK